MRRNAFCYLELWRLSVACVSNINVHAYVNNSRNFTNFLYASAYPVDRVGGEKLGGLSARVCVSRVEAFTDQVAINF